MEVTAPIPGTLAKLNVQLGDKVHIGQVLFVLEVMKMEVAVEAPKGGRVIEVLGQEASFVQQGAVVLVIDESD